MLLTNCFKKINFIMMALAGLSALVLIQQDALAACYRHIMNHSQTPWTITFDASKDGGNVYFQNTPCPKDGPCVIQPGQRIETKFTTTGGSSDGSVIVEDKVAAMNDPADADITIFANCYPGKQCKSLL